MHALYLICFVSYDTSAHVIWWEFILKKQKIKNSSILFRGPNRAKHITFSADIIYTAKK